MLNQDLVSSAYFVADRFVLFNNDSLELLERLDENSVDLIFADPPYNLSNDGFTVQSGKRVSVNKGSWDESKGVENDFAFHRTWIAACYRVLKPQGTIFISGTYHSIYQCGYALQLLGFKILNDIAWYKPNGSPNLSCRYFTASHETLIWAIKDAKSRHTFNYEAMKDGDFPEDSLKKPNKQMRSVWSIATPTAEEKICGKHPTQKSLKLLERIVLSASNKNDLIVDPFSGSSTTGIAAVKHGRKFIGIEREKEYLDLSIKRLTELQKSLKS
ncbi:methyltransferase [Campylobacterota bacterium]|nr:methyltransferase [Campylobacterota bacterium]